MTEDCGLTPAEVYATYVEARDPVAVIASDLRAAWSGDEAVDDRESHIWAEALWSEALECGEELSA
jgi:hypothetical protein